METLTIDRGQWLTGTAGDILRDSCLRHPKSGLQCCLGFLGKAGGFTDGQINRHCTIRSMRLNNDSTHEIPPSQFRQFDWLYKHLDEKDKKRFSSIFNQTVENTLTQINDRGPREVHPSRREAAIKYIFKKYGGIEVEFVGKYAEATKKARKAVPAA